VIKHVEQRVGVFVDVQNMYYSAKNLYDRHVNFANILEEAVAGRKLVRATAYTIVSESQEEKAFFEALRQQGFELRSKDLQIFPGGVKKGDWDVGIAVDAIKMSQHMDVIVLVTGDGDFLPLVQFLRYHGLLVELIAFKKTTSSKLLEEVDDFIDLSGNTRKFLMKKLAGRAKPHLWSRPTTSRQTASQQTSGWHKES